jgi:hypothetical protein
MTTSKLPSDRTSRSDDDTDDFESGKPTITEDNHAENVGQREHHCEREGAKPTISPSNHEQNVGQRGGYHEA